MLFELGQTGDGRAAGRSDHVLEHGRMLAGFEYHRGRAPNGLRRQADRIGTRQASLHTTIRERVDEQIHIGRTTARKARHGIHQPLGHLDGQTDRAKDPLRGRAVLFVSKLTHAKTRSSLAHCRRRVGHRAHDPRPAIRRLLQSGKFDTGCNRNDQGRRLRHGNQMPQRRTGVLRFGAKQNHIASRQRGNFLCYLPTGRCRKLITRGLDRINADDIRRSHHSGANRSSHKCRTHLAATNDAEFHAARLAPPPVIAPASF